MKKTLVLFWLSCIAFLFMGFSSARPFILPEKKLTKAITKIWKVNDFSLQGPVANSCSENGQWFLVVNAEKELGNVYVGRVNSCHAGGCSVNDASVKGLSFEYFDYLLFTDTTGKVLWVKIYNYQATQGHEVMSRGWLNQFKGLTAEEDVEYNRDIEALSGATVSAKALTEDIQSVLDCRFD